MEGPGDHSSSIFLYLVKKGREHSCNKNTSDLKVFKRDKMLCALMVDLTLLTLIVEMVRAMSSVVKKI